MTREELIRLATKIMYADAATEEEMDADIELFRRDVPNPNAMEYFFSRKFSELSAEEIVDKVLSYRPILL